MKKFGVFLNPNCFENSCQSKPYFFNDSSAVTLLYDFSSLLVISIHPSELKISTSTS